MNTPKPDDWKDYPSEPIRIDEPFDVEAALDEKRRVSNAMMAEVFDELKEEFDVK